MPPFRLRSEFAPAGDQPQAIDQLVQGLKAQSRYQTLLLMAHQSLEQELQ
mgnify:CR=1 FL=1